MKIALILGPYSLANRPLDFNNFFNSDRGATGTEIGFVITAENLKQMGHDVSLFTIYTDNNLKTWRDIKLYQINEISNIDDSFDAVVSWNEPDAFRLLKTSMPVRICQQMLNDFLFCGPDFDKFVDVWTSPSETHLQWMTKQLPSGDWKVNPLGVEKAWFKDQEKINNTVIWLSSPDRGLHLLLQQWPQIKKRVPDAKLKIFYHINDIKTGEVGRRMQYVKYAISQLKDFGVEYIGSVSRNSIIDELSKTMVMVGPLSTINPTEGFSCSTMEALAAGCLPIVGDIDCLGNIYGQVACMAPSPVEQHLEKFTNLVVKGLTDKLWRDQVIDKCKTFSDGYTWDKHAETLEKIIQGHTKSKQKTNIQSPHNLVKLNIGAGPNMFAHDGWINYDREDFNYLADYLLKADINEITQCYGYRKLAEFLKAGNKLNINIHDIRNKFLHHNDNSVDLIYIGQVIEHLNPIFEAPNLLGECFRMLKPGGVVRVTTPDLDILIDAYKNNEMEKFASEQPDFYKTAEPSAQLSYIMFGACGHKCTWDYYEGHFFIYSRQSMKTALQKAGFNEIIFFDSTHESLSNIMLNEVIDEGITHSIIVEARK